MIHGELNKEKYAKKLRPRGSEAKLKSNRQRLSLAAKARQLRSGGLAFLLSIAMKENKTQGKEGEDEGVFFRFRDEGAVDDDPHRAVRLRRKPGFPTASTPPIIQGSRIEVANRFVQDAGAYPSRRLPAGIG